MPRTLTPVATEPDLASLKKWAGVEGTPLNLEQLKFAVQWMGKASIRPPVVFAIPTRGTVDTKWAQALFRGYRHPQDEMWVMYGTLVDYQRNALCESFLNSGFDWMLQWDDDVVFLESHVDNVARMLRTAQEFDSKIVAGVYVQKKGDFVPHMYMDVTERADDPKRLYAPLTEYPQGGVIEVDGVGGGCLLIHRDVIQAMADPTERRWFTFRFGFGEDLAFCHQAKQLGFKILADTSIKLGHLTSECLTIDHYFSHQLRMKGDNERKVIEAIADVKAKATDRSVGMPTRPVLEELHEMGARQLRSFLGDKADAMLHDPEPAVRVAEEWKRLNPQTEEEIRSFYQTTDTYLADLLKWNLSNDFARKILQPLRLDGVQVADFGAGIGTLAMLFARQGRQVWSIDLPGVTRDFAEYRYRDLKCHIEQVPEGASGRRYITPRDSLKGMIELDLITAVDTMEHLTLETMRETVQDIHHALRKGGRFLHASSFLQPGEGSHTHPQHTNFGPELDVMLKEVGMLQFDPVLWLKA